MEKRICKVMNNIIQGLKVQFKPSNFVSLGESTNGSMG